MGGDVATKDIEVDTPLISNLNTKVLDELTGTLEAQFRSMCLAVEALNDSWQGPNHDEFVRGFEARSEAIQSFQSHLNKYLFAVQDAYRLYNECEETVAGYVAGSGNIGIS